MPDTMVRVVMVLLTELLFSYVVYEYFCIFFERKAIKGIFICIYLTSVIIQVVLQYLPDDMAYGRLIITMLFLIIVSCFFECRIGERIVFSFLFAAMGMFGEALVGCAVLAFGVGKERQGDIWGIVTYLIMLMIIKILQWFSRMK